MLTLIIPVYGTIYLSNITCSDLIIAIYWYLLAGYLKEIPNNFFERHSVWVLAFSICSVIFLEVLCSIVSEKLGIRTYGIENLIGRFSIFQIIVAVSLFYIFKRLNIGVNMFINIIAQSMLGVYLIHQSPSFRGFLWNNIVNLDFYYKMGNTFTFALALLLGSVLVFLACIIIELLRLYILEKPIFKYVNFPSNLLLKKLNKFMNLS